MNGISFINLIFIAFGYYYIHDEIGLGLSASNYLFSLFSYFGVATFNVIFLNTKFRKLFGLKEIQGSRLSPTSGKYLGYEFGGGRELYGANLFILFFLVFFIYDIFYLGLSNATNYHWFLLWAFLIHLLTIINFHISWKANKVEEENI